MASSIIMINSVIYTKVTAVIRQQVLTIIYEKYYVQIKRIVSQQSIE